MGLISKRDCWNPTNILSCASRPRNMPFTSAPCKWDSSMISGTGLTTQFLSLIVYMSYARILAKLCFFFPEENWCLLKSQSVLFFLLTCLSPQLLPTLVPLLWLLHSGVLFLSLNITYNVFFFYSSHYWKDGLKVKNNCCSCRGPRLSSQYPHGGTTTYNASSRESNMLCWYLWAPGTQMMCMLTYRWNTHVHKIKMNRSLKCRSLHL